MARKWRQSGPSMRATVDQPLLGRFQMSICYSSEHFSADPFKAHGRFDIRCDGDVVLQCAEGPFNLEAVLALTQARQAAAQDWGAARHRHATITVFQGSMLMSPDALEAYASALRADMDVRYASGQPAPVMACVAGRWLEGRALMLPHFAKLHADLNIRWQAFEVMLAARVWVRAQTLGAQAAQPVTASSAWKSFAALAQRPMGQGHAQREPMAWQ